MLYRSLGQTGLTVSAVGLGTAMLGSPSVDLAVRIVRRARDLGVTFFDTARAYDDAEVKLGIALAHERGNVVISSKTTAKTREGAWRDINESLERLRTDYLDNVHLHGLGSPADVEVRLGAGGALDALVQAKEQGMVKHVGCTSHVDPKLLIAAIERFPFETILVPLNVVEREPLARLIPLCRERGVGVTIMKPLATGLVPSPLGLRWLLNQPVDVVCPGSVTLAEVEQNAGAADGDLALSPDESARVESLRARLERVRCRICARCQPCPVDVPIAVTLGTDVMFDHYRTMGPAGFRSFDWSIDALARDLPRRRQTIAAIESCTECGECERRCPHGLPIVEMLRATLPTMRDMISFYETKVG